MSCLPGLEVYSRSTVLESNSVPGSNGLVLDSILHIPYPSLNHYVVMIEEKNHAKDNYSKYTLTVIYHAIFFWVWHYVTAKFFWHSLSAE